MADAPTAGASGRRATVDLVEREGARRVTGGPDVARAATWATLCSGLLIAAQVAGKATRDALFLSSFDITSLPGVLIVTSVASIVAVLIASRASTRWGPRQLFVGTSVLATTLHGVSWALVSMSHDRAAALLVYAQTSVLGAIGISAFWSRVNETFDPRSARSLFSRIAGGGTLGGLVGGLLAERVAAYLPIASMLPMLALLSMGCAVCSLRIRIEGVQPARPGPAASDAADRDSASNTSATGTSALKTLASVSYLRDLALLVVVGTVAATLLDYVFKAQASASFARGPELLRAFAVFYAIAGLLTFLAQLSLSRWVLERGGIAVAVSTLPGVVAAGGIAALALPGLASAAIARGAETVLRSSLFRSGYELFYTPIPPDEKRGTKPIIDVGFDRAGDVLGGALAQGLLVVAPVLAGRLMLFLAAVLGLVGVLVARRLARGYVHALERGLMTRALELDLDEAADHTTKSTLLRTLGGMTLERTSLPGALAAARRSGAAAGAQTGGAPRPSTIPPPGVNDLTTTRFAALRGGDAAAVTSALAEVRPTDTLLVAQVIALLAWDDVAPAAGEALRRFGARITGQLVDALVDAKSDFAVRRRVPRVLGTIEDRRATDGLVSGLADRRFEVRFQCARALALRPKGELDIPRETVLEAVERELKVGKRVWASQRLLDGFDDVGPSPFVDEVLRDRASRSLEHVFTLLALVLPEQPLRVAFRGLHTDDRALRGTALEYLDSVLPDRIRELLLPLVEIEVPRAAPRPAERVVEDLLVSKESIDRRLFELKDQPAPRPEPSPAAEADES
ncbi:MAG: hypothetical protein IT379_13195 [Deltaproteobacteria bacterium]|nr:hypothetical protein [Deltaproteobacteria bacterium]